MIDGATEIALVTDPRAWTTPLLRALRTADDSPKAETVSLPHQGTGYLFEVAVKGRDLYLLRAPNAVDIQLNRRSGRIAIRLRRELALTKGLRGLEPFLQSVCRWTGLADVVTLETCRDVGAEVSRSDICGDFLNVPVHADHGHRFTGRAKPDVYGEGRDGSAETIAMGSAKSGRRLTMMNKIAQIPRCNRGMTPERSPYAPGWFAAGWDGGAPVTRIEVQLRGSRGLRFRTKDGETVDLRDPAVLLRPDLLVIVFLSELHRTRLHCNDATRASRCTIDPLWLGVIDAVRGATAQEPDGRPTRLRQDRSVQQRIHAVEKQRADRGVERALMRWAAVHRQRVASEGDWHRLGALAARNTSRSVDDLDRWCCRMQTLEPECFAAGEALVRPNHYLGRAA